MPFSTDDFESGLGQWTQTGSPSVVTTHYVNTSHSVKIDTSAGSARQLTANPAPTLAGNDNWHYVAFGLFVPSWSTLWDGGNGWDPYIASFTPGPGFYIQPTSSSTGVVEYNFGGGNGGTHDSTAVPDNQWVAIRLAYRYNSGHTVDLQFFVNGTASSVFTSTGSITAPVTGLILGDDGSTGNVGVDLSYYLDAVTFATSMPSDVNLSGAFPSSGGGGTAAPGVSVAFTSDALDATPTWVRIDDTTVCHVTSWSIDRGRAFELDRINTGTATVNIIDTAGNLDPTNSSSPYYGFIDPLRPASIALQNPVDLTWTTLFQGFVEDWDYTLDVSEKFFTLRLTLVDGLDFLGNAEVVPGAGYGTTVPAGSEGNVFYAEQNVDDRIRAALADAGWPSGLEDIFSGNVVVQDTVYAPRSTILQVIQDAADAEWPGVANFYMSKDGKARFRGRLARFNPTNITYHIGAWKCGDKTAVAADTGKGTIAGLSFERGLSKIINAALATPQGVADSDIAGNLATDSGSITSYGVRSWSAENLITQSGLESGTPDALDETKKFSTYYESNFHAPQNRINQVTLRPVETIAANATAHWALICGVEIGDTITVTTTHPGGGGFSAEPCFVEGIHYEAAPMRATMYDITVTLDLSPAAYFTSDPGF